MVLNTTTRNRSLGRMKRQPPRHGIVTQHRSDSPQNSSSGSSPPPPPEPRFHGSNDASTSKNNNTINNAIIQDGGARATTAEAVILRNRNSQISTGSGSGAEAHRKLNRLSTSSSLSIITPPTTPKRPAGGSRGKMAFSLSLAHNFNQKLASLNDKWNDFSFILKGSNAGATGGRNDSYHSIESAVTCTATDLEAGNFSGGGGGDDPGQGGSRGLWNSSGKHHQHHRHHQKPYERRHKQRRSSPRRNSASGDPKEFDMLVLRAPDDNGEDNESF
ncbi:hypothetical protein quinque_009043 [Culex quinquefasciatus]